MSPPPSQSTAASARCAVSISSLPLLSLAAASWRARRRARLLQPRLKQARALCLPTLVLGFIGSGAMATALITGLIRSNALPASRIAASDPDESKVQQLVSELHISGCSSNSELVSGCSIVVLAVKPQVVQAVMREVGQLLREDQLLISIAAGVTLHTLCSRCCPQAAWSRAWCPTLPR